MTGSIGATGSDLTQEPRSQEPRLRSSSPVDGADTGAGGEGIVTGQRLYRLIRGSAKVLDQTSEVAFLDRGAWACAFRFG
jgi:hypothetical protein